MLKQRIKSMLWMVIAFVIGVSTSLSIGEIVRHINAGELAVSDVKFTTASGGGYKLNVVMRIKASSRCVGITQFELYRGDLGTREYLLLGSRLTGGEFVKGLDHGVYTAALHVPEDKMITGDWQFRARVLYVCQMFPGFADIRQWQSESWPIHLDQGHVPINSHQRVIDGSADHRRTISTPNANADPI